MGQAAWAGRCAARLVTAQVHAFPIHRHRGRVDRLAQDIMRAGEDDPRDVLIDSIGVEWDRLEALGVECDEIELRIYELARELWSRVDAKTNLSPGAA